MRTFPLVLSLLAAACASSSSNVSPSAPQERMFNIPGQQAVHAGPGCALHLELDGSLPPLISGTRVRIPFVIRNVTGRVVSSCTISGVSVLIRGCADGKEVPWFPLVIQGATMDAGCSNEVRLAAGQTEDFAREIAVPSLLTPGPATLRASLGFDSWAFNKNDCGEALEWQRDVTIVPAPARASQP